MQALKIRQASQDAGFYAPEIEDVAGKGLKSASVPQIRYFREINAEYATLVAKTLLNLGYKNVRIDRIPSFANRVTRNLIEIWLP